MSSILGTDKVAHQLNFEDAVRERYSAASQAAEPALCCPVQYDKSLLEALPDELIERDYGCGDPSKYVRQGETVLDLGSGGGKICFIASQIVGPTGRVIGVDMNDDMLALARKYQVEIGERIGWQNTEFHKGRIQDLGLDLEQLEKHLQSSPIDSANAWLAAQQKAATLRVEQPMIATDSVDVVLSNCVLNLVAPEDRRKMFREVHRVLRPGGRAVISDIVSDEFVPNRLRNDPKLWSGCISGAFIEHEFVEEFEKAGFYGIEIVDRQTEPWAVIEGIEFRSLTLRAYKAADGACMDHKQAVIYKGPWKSVTADDGQVLQRGVRAAVCAKNYDIYSSAPFSAEVINVPPQREVPLEQAKPFDCGTGAVRDPRETKNGSQLADNLLPVDNCCETSGGCC